MSTCPHCGGALDETPMFGLTLQQRKVLTFLADYAVEHGVAPSFEDIRTHMGLASKSGVFQLLRGLEERGRIRRLPYRARAIEVIHA